MLDQKLSLFFSTLLYKSRLLTIAIALLFVLYGIIFISFYTPQDAPFLLWRPDTQLTIQAAPSHSELKPGDRVLAIDGQVPVRMRAIYPLPLKTEYTITIQRNTETKVYPVSVTPPPNIRTLLPFLPTMILALAGWLVGSVILLFSRKENTNALTAGTVFLLSAVVLIGIQASLEGAPGAWIAGHSGIFILAVGWVYLGTIPRVSPLSMKRRQFLLGLFIGSLVLSGAAAFEVLSLFPRQTSFQEVIGVSFYSLGFFLAGLGLISCVIQVAWRYWQLPRKHYLRQQLTILLISIGIGTMPAMLLTILPRALWDVTLLPFPVAIVLMLFIPLGYLFVIYRRGFLKLDIIFSQIAYLTLLGLLVYGFYIGSLYLLQRWWELPGQDLLLPATVVFIPTLLIAAFASRPIRRFVQQAVFDDDQLSQAKLAEIAWALAVRPELATLENMVQKAAGMVNASQCALVLINDAGQLVSVRQGETQATRLNTIADIKMVNGPVLRSRLTDQQKYQSLFEAISWAELMIPIQIRQEPVGLMVLSRSGANGYFNAWQLDFLTQVASLLAVGSENISLFETTLKLSRERLAFQEQERRKLSQQIHDDPLQQITYAKAVLDQMMNQQNGDTSKRSQLPEVTSHLRQSAQTLREICIGLYSPMQEQGIDLAILEIAAQFQTKYALQTAVSLQPDIQNCITLFNDQQVTAICRILTEALNNVVKHAPEATVSITLAYAENHLELSIIDDGPGSSLVYSSFSELMRQGHMGIVSMHEWARLAGGRLQLMQDTPSGLAILFLCPTVAFSGENRAGNVRGGQKVT